MSTDKIFVDTWAWLALANRRDKYHEQKEAIKKLRKEGIYSLHPITFWMKL